MITHLDSLTFPLFESIHILLAKSTKEHFEFRLTSHGILVEATNGLSRQLMCLR